MSAVPKASFPLLAGAVVAALALAAGCGGGSHGGAGLPSAIPGALPNPAAQTVSDARPDAGKSIDVTIVTLPLPAHVQKALALGLELDANASTFTPVNLKAASPCVQRKDQTFVCHVTLHAAAGLHTLGVTTYKSFLKGNKKPAGAPVSANTVPVNAVHDRNSILLSMYSLTSRIDVTGLSSRITGDTAHGFTADRFAAKDKAPFSVIGRDAAKRFVIGPGSPAFDLKRSNAQFVITTPAPDEFDLAAPTIATAAATKIDVILHGSHAPTCTAECKLSFDVSLGPVGSATPTPSPSPTPSITPSPSPTPSHAPTPTPSPTPYSSPTPTPTPMPAAIYVTYNNGAVVAFDEQGHKKTLAGSWANAGNANAISYDSANSQFYIVTGSTPSITSYDVSGNPVSLSGSFTSTPVAMTVEPSPTHRLYVATHVGASNDAIDAYDSSGVFQSGFGTTLVAAGPNAIAYDGDNGHLIFANSSSGKAEEYTLAGSLLSTTFAPPTGCSGCTPTAVIYVHDIRWPYVLWTGANNYFNFYSQSGGNQIGQSPALTAPTDLAEDSHNQMVYVTDGTSVKVFDEFGRVQTTTGTFPAPVGATAANSIAIVPPS